MGRRFKKKLMGATLITDHGDERLVQFHVVSGGDFF